MHHYQPHSVELAWLRRRIWPAVLFGFVVNLLSLAMPFFCLLVFDKVLVSQSSTALGALILFFLPAFLSLGFIDNARRRYVAHLGEEFLARIATHRGPGSRQDHWPQAELALAQAFRGNLVTALVDLAWLPLPLAALFLLHPMLGLIGVSVLCTALPCSISLWRCRSGLPGQARRGPTGSQAGAFAPLLRSGGHDAKARASRLAGEDRRGAVFSRMQTTRTLAQALAVAAGVSLVMHQAVGPGAIVAGSVLVARTGQLCEQALREVGTLRAALGAWRWACRTQRTTATPPARKFRIARVA